jgi:O-methyltransferase involved in polyketide biosynthesis
MEPLRPSNTAAFTAMLRAAHQIVDSAPRILDDPVSVGLVEDATHERIAAQRAALLSPQLMIPRAAVVLRSRYAEDLLAKAVAALPVPSTIVMSFMLPDADLSESEASAARTVADEAAKKGEPWLTRLRPIEFATRLSSLGFKEVVHLSPEEANDRYFAGRRDGLQAVHVAQMMSATN